MCGQNGLRNLMVPAEENPDQLYRPCAFCHTFPHGTTSNQVRVHYIRGNLLYKHTPVKTMWSEPDRCRSLTVNLSVTVTLACYVTASCRSCSYVPRLAALLSRVPCFVSAPRRSCMCLALSQHYAALALSCALLCLSITLLLPSHVLRHHAAHVPCLNMPSRCSCYVLLCLVHQRDRSRSCSHYENQICPMN